MIKTPIFSNPTITIADVAREANVSVSTVSRILNGKPDVATATRQRVEQIIEKLGYAPLASAQSLAAGKSRTLGLLFTVEHAAMTQLEVDFFVGAAEAAEAQNYFMTLVTRPVDETRLLNLYRAGQVDGTILMQVRLDDWRVQQLQCRGYPFVLIGRTAQTDHLSYVDLNFEAAIDLAFTYLSQLGHRRIGFVARPAAMREQGIGAAVRSLQSYRRACEQHGVEEMFCEPSLNADSIYGETLRLFQQHNPTAVIAANGPAVMPIMQAAAAAGRRVPDDLALVAITTNRVANLLSPSPTTINFPTDRIGYLAARMLIRQLETPNTPAEQILLAPELLPRDTTPLLLH